MSNRYDLTLSELDALKSFVPTDIFDFIRGAKVAIPEIERGAMNYSKSLHQSINGATCSYVDLTQRTQHQRSLH